jgi:hypothetical protein
MLGFLFLLLQEPVHAILSYASRVIFVRMPCTAEEVCHPSR